MAYALEVVNVGKSYDKFELHNINFRLEEGLILGLIGTNGAGKTTLIHMILGLLKKSGTIKIFGYDTEEFEKKAKDLCGFVLDENPFLKPVSGIGNARMFGPYYSGWDEKKFLSYCKKFNVNVKKPLMKLSQGTVIKFQLAFALSHDAKLLVFDEPSAGLDPIFRRELIDLMYEVIMEGDRSVIFSTHLTQDLDNVADYILMLHKGEQLFFMPKDELLDQYLLVRGRKEQLLQLPEDQVVGRKDTETFSEALIYNRVNALEAQIISMRPTIEDIMYYHVKKV